MQWENDGHANALGILGLYIARASYSEALGLLAAATALHIADGPPLLVAAAFTAGAAKLGVMIGRRLDEGTRSRRRLRARGRWSVTSMRTSTPRGWTPPRLRSPCSRRGRPSAPEGRCPGP